jgi:alpha-L-fucosidase
MTSKSTLLILLVLITILPMAACTNAFRQDSPPAEIPANMQWWSDARFGMFIHWGPVSLKGTEIGWSRGTKVKREEYDSLYKEFNPTEFDATRWVSIAKQAGMKYIVITSKHHDGFCIWDTKTTDYNVMNSPFGRDILRELSDECKREGIKFCTYYSILDWYHPDYNTAGTYGGPGFKLPKGQKPDMDRYIRYMNTHLAEIIKDYGPLGIMWFDGEWEKPWSYEYGKDLYSYVKSLQGDIIINNRVGKMRQGMAGTTKQDVGNPGDYDTPEQQIGAFQNQRPWETCMTICRQWAWKPDDNMKSFKECIQTLIRVAGGDGNLLFNVGPMPDGRIEPRQVERLKEMGRWLNKYGDGIYATRGGPFKPGKWGASTCKDNRIYLYIMNWQINDKLILPSIDMKVKSSRTLSAKKADVKELDKSIEITLPKSERDEVATIIELTVDGEAFDIIPVDVADPTVAHLAKPESIEKWKDKRFGMFIHWGPVSLKGTEIGWSRKGPRRGRARGGTGTIPMEEYDSLYKKFDPVEFDADQWVQVAKDAGMQYMVFTSKHHDGFSMFDSAYTDYKVTNSLYKKDICKELADACHRQGLGLGWYYSPRDWYHPDFATDNHQRYLDFYMGQLRELCSNYGKLDIFWFDGLDSPREIWNDIPVQSFFMIRDLQPDIVLNNRGGLPGDFDTPEQRVGGFNIERPWETCMTICRQWAWKPNDNMKSLKQCLQTLIRTAGGDGNLLFNVGPMPDGRIESRQVERLKEMGQWLKKYGETIYETRGGPFKPGPWGASTRKGNDIYLHILQWRGDSAKLAPIPAKIVKSSVLTGGFVQVIQTDEYIEVKVPPADRDEIDTIVALTLDKPASEIKAIASLPSGSIALGKKAAASNVIQKNYAPGKAFDDNSDTRWATKAGTKQAWIEVDLGKTAKVTSAMIDEGNWNRVKKFQLQYKQKNEWKTIVDGTTIGEKKELKFDPVTARIFRLNILDATEGPTIWEFQLFETEND